MNFIKESWANLEGAYGNAEDVGDLLDALRSQDESTWKQANYDLGGVIFNQYTLFPATVKAIPELIDMLYTEKSPKLENIISLLGFIGTGIGKCATFFGDDFKYCLKGKGRIATQSILEEAIDGENDFVRALEVLVFLYMPLIEFYITSDDDLTREGVAGAMGAYGKQYPHYTDILNQCLETEEEDNVIEALNYALNDEPGQSQS